MLTLKEVDAGLVTALVSELMKDVPTVPIGDQKSYAPKLFGITRNTETCAPELGYSATVRYGIMGNRRVIMANTSAVWDYLHATEGDALTLKKCFDFVKGGTVDQLKGLAAASSDASLPVMYSGTVGPRDMLITPAGWIFYEHVGNSDVVGVKVNYLARHDLHAFETLSRLHLSVGKPCTMVDEAIASIRRAVS